MKQLIQYFFFFSILLISCQHQSNNQKKKIDSIVIDSTFRDTVKHHIEFISDKYFSNFKTPIEVRSFTDGIQKDSIIQNDFQMISWYFISKDTIDLVAHIGNFESIALLIRFLKNQPTPLFYRASHEKGDNFFKVNKSDTLRDQIEVYPDWYQLKLSEIPDTIKKQVIYGYINMKSGDYYEKRDSVEKKRSIEMKFYFRSQYRKFG
jgi:hypothetical protein